MKRPKTMDEYVRLVDEALMEIQDLREAIEFDDEEMSEALGFVDTLDSQIREFRQALAQADYGFEDRDLPFMAIVAKQSPHFLPFKGLLETINQTHRQGLDSGDETPGV